jgi:hypothetical protein
MGSFTHHDRIQILIVGFDDETELGAQARQRQFYNSRYVHIGHGNRLQRLELREGGKEG